MSRLKTSDQLWKEFVPVAFHVGYWDYIGWEDRFAKQEYTQRQRRYAAEYGERTVYTPGMRLDGNEWRDWLRIGNRLPEATQPQEPGSLSLTISDTGEFRSSFDFNTAEFAGNSAQLTLVVLGPVSYTHLTLPTTSRV